MSAVASGSVPEPASEPTPTIALFARGVWSLFLLWPALRLAVAQEWGGPESKEKRLWFASTIVDEFESRHLKHATSTPSLTPPAAAAAATTGVAPVSSIVSSESITADLAATSLSTLVPPPFGLDLDTLSDLLFDILLEEFETDTEDGSTEQIAKQLLVLWSAAVNLDESLVKQLEAEAEKVSKSKVQASRGADDEDDEDEEDNSDDYSDMSEGEDERPPALVPAAVKEEPEIDEDGFTMVKGKGKKR